MIDAGLHKYLDVLLALRRTCEREGFSGEAVQALLAECLRFVVDIMGKDVFRRAMRSGQDGEGLLLLANRFAQMQPLLADNWPGDFAFNDLVQELFAIANGDEPRILKGASKQGKFGSAHALLERKLEAHIWYKVLGHLGLKAALRRDLIEESFATPFDTYNSWRREGRRKLGSDYVERLFVTAVAAKLFAASLEADPILWATGETRAAGGRYRRELKLTAA